MRTSYHPKNDGQTERVNQRIQGYLRNYVIGQQKSWATLLHLGEFYYNTTFHLSIRMTPFMDLYGYEAPYFVDIMSGDCRSQKYKGQLQENQDILRALKENLQVAQNQQKMNANKHMIDRVFRGDLLYLRMQPYRQSSLKKRGDEKLQPRFYGPYKILKKIGEVAYELELPPEIIINNVFHVSCMKKAARQQIFVSEELPPLDDKGHLVLVQEKVLQTRERRLRNKTIKEYMVQWKGLPSEDATWEGEQILQHPRLLLLEDKQIWEGCTIMPLP